MIIISIMQPYCVQTCVFCLFHHFPCHLLQLSNCHIVFWFMFHTAHRLFKNLGCVGACTPTLNYGWLYSSWTVDRLNNTVCTMKNNNTFSLSYTHTHFYLLPQEMDSLFLDYGNWLEVHYFFSVLINYFAYNREIILCPLLFSVLKQLSVQGIIAIVNITIQWTAICTFTVSLWPTSKHRRKKRRRR